MFRFVWKIKLNEDSSETEFLKFWKESSLLLQEYPGAKGTLAHKAQDEDRTYFLIAQWKDVESRTFMQDDINKAESDRAKKYSKFPKNETWGEIQTVFAGEEVDGAYPSK